MSVPGVPEVPEAGPDASFVFSLLRDSQIIFHYLGWRGDDYELKHELRALALRLERGDFQAAMKWVKEATAHQQANRRGNGN